MNKIPKNIYLCYKDKNIPSYIIPKYIELNPKYNIFLYDDNDCINFLYENFGQKHVDIFNYIKHGPIKSDFWRICILYINGGIYCDIDIIPAMSFDSIITENSAFITSASKVKNYLNPIILMSIKQNQILQKCINHYISLFEKQKYSYWSWSICPILYKYTCEELKTTIVNNKTTDIIHNDFLFQFLTEVPSGRRSTMRTLYKKNIVCHNHYDTYKSREHSIGFTDIYEN